MAIYKVSKEVGTRTHTDRYIIFTIDFLSSLLRPEEERYLDFQVEANATSHLYVSVHGRRNGDKFHWDSPMLKAEVLGNPAEIENIFVSNGDIGGDIEAETTVKGMGDSEGLKLVFWMDTPSGKYEELSEIKTRKLSKGEEAVFKAKIKAKEEGFYTVYANLYDDHGRIDRDHDIIWVERRRNELIE